MEENGTPKTDAEYEDAVEHYLREIERMSGQMAEDQREIELLRAETDTILADIMQTLMPAGTVRRSVVDVLAKAPGHRAFQDAAAVDAYVWNERDAWNYE